MTVRATSSTPSLIGKIAVAALALGGAVQVVRSAVVQQSVTADPAAAAKLWPAHPEVALALAMADIGSAAREGRGPSPETVKLSAAAARRAPLAIEPFLIEGAIAQSKQQGQRAERLFGEAARRDPRSSAARFLLAQLYLASGRPGEGLRHSSALVRLGAGASTALVPAIAQYAKSPGAIPNLRRMFAGDVTLRDAVMSDLARDAANSDLILTLAGDDIGRGGTGATPAWQAGLLAALTQRGDHVRAHALWLRISGLRSAPVGLFNPQFAKLKAPAPFNWTYGSGEFGFAESADGGSLQVMYYGRANGEFASQTMLLAPGAYALSMRALRTSEKEGASGLAWSVVCGETSPVLLTLPIGETRNAAQPLLARFTVPAGCSSQKIRLTGTTSDYAPTEQVTISDLKLVRSTS